MNIPHSNASNIKAAQSSLHAAGPPSTGASSCSLRLPFHGSLSSSWGCWEVLSWSSTAVGSMADGGSATVTSSVLLITNVLWDKSCKRAERVTVASYEIGPGSARELNISAAGARLDILPRPSCGEPPALVLVDGDVKCSVVACVSAVPGCRTGHLLSILAPLFSSASMLRFLF